MRAIVRIRNEDVPVDDAVMRRRLSTQRPGHIQTWAVEVDGTLWPVKQAARAAVEAAPQLPKGATSHAANRVLRRLNFEPFEVGTQLSAPALAPTPDLPALDQQRRITAFNAAVAVATQNGDADADAVIELAEKFEAFLSRP